MPIVTPGKHLSPRLAKSRLFGKGAHGRRTLAADLLITPLVDMFVIIVIFLLQNLSATGEILFMSKEIALPAARNGTELDRSPVIQISRDSILIEGEEVAKVADLEKSKDWEIPALIDRLREQRRRYELLHSTNSPADDFRGDINIQAHKEVLFRTLKRVMYSCNQAGYNNLNYAVTGLASGDATAQAPRPAPPQ